MCDLTEMKLKLRRLIFNHVISVTECNRRNVLLFIYRMAYSDTVTYYNIQTLLMVRKEVDNFRFARHKTGRKNKSNNEFSGFRPREECGSRALN
jgi:hypothetical protein